VRGVERAQSLHPPERLDPELPTTLALIRDALAGVAEIFSTPYLHNARY
jgi:hypothetical protein